MGASVRHPHSFSHIDVTLFILPLVQVSIQNLDYFKLVCIETEYIQNPLLPKDKNETLKAGGVRPEVSGHVPCIRPNMFPQALLTAAILARTGRLWMTKETSLRCCLARF